MEDFSGYTRIGEFMNGIDLVKYIALYNVIHGKPKIKYVQSKYKGFRDKQMGYNVSCRCCNKWIKKKDFANTVLRREANLKNNTWWEFSTCKDFKFGSGSGKKDCEDMYNFGEKSSLRKDLMTYRQIRAFVNTPDEIIVRRMRGIST